MAVSWRKKDHGFSCRLRGRLAVSSCPLSDVDPQAFATRSGERGNSELSEAGGSREAELGGVLRHPFPQQGVGAADQGMDRAGFARLGTAHHWAWRTRGKA